MLARALGSISGAYRDDFGKGFVCLVTNIKDRAEVIDPSPLPVNNPNTTPIGDGTLVILGDHGDKPLVIAAFANT